MEPRLTPARKTGLKERVPGPCDASLTVTVPSLRAGARRYALFLKEPTQSIHLSCFLLGKQFLAQHNWIDRKIAALLDLAAPVDDTAGNLSGRPHRPGKMTQPFEVVGVDGGAGLYLYSDKICKMQLIFSIYIFCGWSTPCNFPVPAIRVLLAPLRCMGESHSLIPL